MENPLTHELEALEGEPTPDLLPRRSLSGHRVILVGFDEPQAHWIARLLAAQKCMSRSIAPERLLWETADLALADLVMFNWCEATLSSKWIKRGGLRDLKKPALLVGSLSDLSDMPVDLPALSDFIEADNEKMLEAMRRLLTKADDAHRDSSGAHIAERVRVLVIDDDSEIRLLIGTLLENLGLECHMAFDGRHGVRMARKVMPHLVILDVDMPAASGFDVLAAIRNYPGTSAALVMMLSGCHSEADVKKGYQLKADDYVMKPFSALHLSTRVRKLSKAVWDSSPVLP